MAIAQLAQFVYRPAEGPNQPDFDPPAGIFPAELTFVLPADILYADASGVDRLVGFGGREKELRCRKQLRVSCCGGVWT
jgi:hypothetical protein